MGYRILDIDPEFRAKYEERPGLEGPFFFDNNLVLYYDPSEGAYLCPQTDCFLSYDEYVERTGAFRVTNPELKIDTNKEAFIVKTA